MSQAAARTHAAVEPAESPLTPESWGKLGMWIFLAGDAVGFGTLLAAYGVHARHQRRLAEPLRGPRHQPDRGHDVPAHLLERHDGQGARVAGQGRPGALQEVSASTPRSAARSSWACRPTSGRTSSIAACTSTATPGARRCSAPRSSSSPASTACTSPAASSICSRSSGVGGAAAAAGGQLQRGRDRRAVLALRRPRLDHGLHLHVPPVGGRERWRREHKHPELHGDLLVLAILTVVEIGVVFLPFGKMTIGTLLCALAVAKAALVAMYFMHLRFETRTLGLIAVTPLAIATLLVFVLMPDALRGRSPDRRRQAGRRRAGQALSAACAWTASVRDGRRRRRWRASSARSGGRSRLRCPRCGRAPLFRGWFR